jgi:hypothetical protein
LREGASGMSGWNYPELWRALVREILHYRGEVDELQNECVRLSKKNAAQGLRMTQLEQQLRNLIEAIGDPQGDGAR